MQTKQVRHNLSPLTIRRSDGVTTIGGHAAVFFNRNDPGSEFPIGSGVVERIMKGAFTRSLAHPDKPPGGSRALKDPNNPPGASRDIVALAQHDNTAPIGRVSAGNLRLSQDTKGLAFEVDLPNTTVARDLAVLVGDGIINGASFGFKVRAGGQTLKAEGDRTIRELTDIDLIEVSAVTFPAFASATVGMRAESDELDEAFAVDLQRWRYARGRRRAVDLRMADLLDR